MSTLRLTPYSDARKGWAPPVTVNASEVVHIVMQPDAQPWCTVVSILSADGDARALRVREPFLDVVRALADASREQPEVSEWPSLPPAQMVGLVAEVAFREEPERCWKSVTAVAEAEAGAVLTVDGRTLDPAGTYGNGWQIAALHRPLAGCVWRRAPK